MANQPNNNPNNNKPALIGDKATADTLLKSMIPQFQAALGKMIGVERFARMALTAINKNEKLLLSTQSSVLASLMDCAQLGLVPNSPLKQASLIPYKNGNVYECKLIIEYGGYCALAYRTGTVDSICAEVVYDCDEFTVVRGSNELLDHRPFIGDRPKTAKKKAVYCYIKNKGGGIVFAVMYPEEVYSIRNRSQNYKASKQYNFQTPWDTDEDEMFKKTAVRRAMKLANISEEYIELIDKDGDNDYLSPEMEVRIPNTSITSTSRPDLTPAPQPQQLPVQAQSPAPSQAPPSAPPMPAIPDSALPPEMQPR